MNDNVSVLLRFWPALMEGRVGLVDLAAIFSDAPRVSFPPTREVEGCEALSRHLVTTHEWLTGQNASWTPIAKTDGGSRVVDEGILVLQRPAGEIRLPVASVADFEKGRISWLRIYHSMWPLQGKHALRPPLLPPGHDLRLSGPAAMYQDALARGDVEGILSAFSPNGCAREPSGGEYTYCGSEKLRVFYDGLFSHGGGVGLEHCTVTDDGVRTAIEYNCFRLGKTELPPQAGVAVYERRAGGLLGAARIYDDVDVPS